MTTVSTERFRIETCPTDGQIIEGDRDTLDVGFKI